MKVLFHSGNIYTPYGIDSWMIIDGNRIVETGKDIVGLDSFAGKLVDLAGQLVLPGLQDAHIHNYSLGRSQFRLKLHGTSSISELQDRLSRFDTNQEWLIGHGWDQDEMEDSRYPNREDIDIIESTKPVLLYRACNHIGLVNSKALEVMGIHASTKDPEGGIIDRDEDGEPTGILRENALSLVSDYIQPLDDNSRMDYYRTGLQTCLEKGLTSIQTNDAYAWQYYKELAERDELPIRVFLTLKYTDLDNDSYLPSYNEQVGLLKCKRVKLFADGSLGAETAALRDNYHGLDHNGILIDSPEVLANKIARIHKLGYQLEVHAIGDYATEIVIQGFKQAGIGKEDRPLITHCQVLAPDLIEEMATSGYIANVQPPFVPTDARWAEKRLGKGERLGSSYAWKTLLDNGVVVSGGSDAPIEDPDPFWGIYCSIIRPDPSGDTWRADECLTIEEALELYTINAAYAVNEESELGRIESGYLADFVICDPKILEDTQSLLEGPVEQVWVNGKLQFQRDR